MTNSTHAAVVAGIDIGYGNLKAVGGLRGPGGKSEIVLPAGAAPLSAMPRRSDARADLMGGEEVLIEDQGWAAGVEQIHIQNRTRLTHENYPTTREYRALYLAALARLGFRKIDMVVTGLPVSQYYGPQADELKAKISAMMVGRQPVNSETVVDVAEVMVVPQPMGTFFGVATEPKFAALATAHLQILVFDPGFFSVDWVVMSGQSVMHQWSGTSKLATSVILENAAADMTKDLRRQITRDQLDAALRRGSPTLKVGLDGEADFRASLATAAVEVGSTVADEVMTSLRNARQIDLIIVTGGGAELYEPALRAAFPQAELVTPADLVLGNARGYHSLGAWKLARAAGQAGKA